MQCIEYSPIVKTKLHFITKLSVAIRNQIMFLKIVYKIERVKVVLKSIKIVSLINVLSYLNSGSSLSSNPGDVDKNFLLVTRVNN